MKHNGYIVFNVYSGKMVRTALSEYAAQLHCNFNAGTDYLPIDEIFAEIVREYNDVEV